MKDVKGYEGRYKVTRDGKLYSVKSKRFIGHLNAYGYYRASLQVGKYKYKTFFIHRLVAEAYIPNPENKPYINHIDGNKTNNCVSNLEWCTPQENIMHAYKTHLMDIPKPRKGEANGNAKFSDAVIKEIVESNMKQKDICKKYGISRGYIWKLRAGQFRMGDEAKMLGGGNA